MNLSDIIPEGCVLADLKSTQKEDVLREMLAALERTGKIGQDDSALVVRRILDRESLGSTGIGSGVAVPHATYENDLVCIVARSKGGVDYGSIDGQPVFLLFMLLASRSASGAHLDALASLSRLVRYESLIKRIQDAENADEIRDLLDGGNAALDG